MNKMKTFFGYLLVISFLICAASVTSSPTPPNDGQMKVVCYFSNWAYYRLEYGQYEPDHIDPKLCTHIVYAFTILDPESLTIKTYEHRIDIGYQTLRRVAEKRQHGIKVLVAIGGFEDSFSDKYGRLLSNVNSRRKFIESVVEFIKKHNFDGLELDFEFPTCWQNHCDPYKKQEKQHFVQLVKELSEAFKPNGWLLSSVVSSNQRIIDSAYDVPQLAQHLDWFALISYDYHTSSDKKTGHAAPLYAADNLSIDNTVKYFIQKGAPARKLVMGIKSTGQSFTLENTEHHGLYAAAKGPGLAGPIANIPGELAHYEICKKIKENGWIAVNDADAKVGSYAYKNNQWVSYDDVNNIRAKADYIREMNLGGGLIRTLDLDDFRGICGCGTYPLLTALNNALRNIDDDSLHHCIQ